MTTLRPYEFNDSVWPLQGALDWIVYRDPQIIGDPIAPRAATRFGHSPVRHCADPERALLEKLRRGRVAAYDGDKPLSRDFWIDKDWLYIRRAVSLLFWRDILLEVWPAIVETDKLLDALPGWRKVQPDIMRADQADKHILLWDAADEMSRESGHTPEWHWLRLIEAFLKGNLTQSDLVHFYRNYDASAPRGYQRYSPDDFRAAIEVRAGLAELTIETLRNWTWKDYKNLPEFSPKEPWRSKEHFVERDPDGRFGLAIMIAEFNHWLSKLKAVDAVAVVTPPTTLVPASDPAVTPSVKKRRRGPVPGTVDRYGKADRILFGQLETIMRTENISASAAAKKLAEDDKIAGNGTPESCATRLVKRYRQEKDSQNPL